MLQKTATKKKGDKIKVSFVLPADGDLRDVFVAGDFNGWDPTTTELRHRGGDRSASVTLDAGRAYQFRYYRDGEWFNDDAADGYEPNGYGGANGVIDLTAFRCE
jgi:1,4-alpha-glucan branching enzyme